MTHLETGQVAVVTGGASGIGYGLAAAFGARGLRVALADVDPERLDTAAKQLVAAGVEVLAVPTDVRDPDAVEALAGATIDRFGQVDILCNNAGVTSRRAFSWEQDLVAWRWLFDVMVMGSIHGIRSFVPRLVAQGHGHVLVTASIAGLMPTPTAAPYGTTKAALVALSESLREELRVAGVDVGVTILCPGAVETGLHATSDALRPAGMAGEGERADAKARAGQVILDGDAVAALALAAIEADQVHVLTHPDTAAPIRARLAALEADLPPAPSA